MSRAISRWLLPNWFCVVSTFGLQRRSCASCKASSLAAVIPCVFRNAFSPGQNTNVPSTPHITVNSSGISSFRMLRTSPRSKSFCPAVNLFQSSGPIHVRFKCVRSYKTTLCFCSLASRRRGGKWIQLWRRIYALGAVEQTFDSQNLDARVIFVVPQL